MDVQNVRFERRISIIELHIDEELKAWIDPLSPDEYALLESNILRDGCRDPLVAAATLCAAGAAFPPALIKLLILSAASGNACIPHIEYFPVKRLFKAQAE